jgi:hypothetical protein
MLHFFYENCIFFMQHIKKMFIFAVLNYLQK